MYGYRNSMRRPLHRIVLLLLAGMAAGAPALAGPRQDAKADQRRKTQEEREKRQGRDNARPPKEFADRDGAIDLLKGIDLKNAVKVGDWSMSEKGLRCEATGNRYFKIVIGDAPSGDYDFRIEFTRDEGDGRVAQVMSYQNKTLAWMMNAVRGDGGRFLDLRPGQRTNSFAGAALSSGQRYEAVVCLRKTGISAYLDGQPIMAAPMDAFSQSVGGALASEDGKLAIAAASPTLFHVVEVVPVKAKKAKFDENGKPNRQNNLQEQGTNALLPKGSSWRGTLNTTVGRTIGQEPVSMKVISRTSSQVVFRLLAPGHQVTDWSFAINGDQLRLTPNGISKVSIQNTRVINGAASGQASQNAIQVKWSWTFIRLNKNQQQISTQPEYGTLELQSEDF